MSALYAVLITIVALFIVAVCAARAGNLTFSLRRAPKEKS